MITPDPSLLPPLRVLGDEARVLLRKSASPTRTAAILLDAAPGSEVPPHTHAEEEECYFVLSGQLTITVAERTTTVGAGGFVHIPPRTVHAYRNPSSTTTRFLVWTVGGSIDEFFQLLDRDVRQLPQDLPALHRAMQQHGIDPVGDAFRAC